MKRRHWTDEPLVALDTETTGTDPKTARILEAAIVTCDPTGILEEDDRVIYIDPGIEIPAEASAIHGITAEKLKAMGAYSPQAGISYILNIINGRATMRNYPLVIYNTPYDWPLLMAECQRIPELQNGLFDTPYFLDPLVIDRALDKYRKGSRKLEDTAKYYGVTLNGAHGAQADATATLGVMTALIKKYPQLRALSLKDLQKLQADWYSEWRNRINQYWEKTGKADRVKGEWPKGETA